VGGHQVHFIVLPVPSWVAAGGPSFGFQVNHGGADVRMEPRPRATTPRRCLEKIDAR
jgi:hypothetical protein